MNNSAPNGVLGRSNRWEASLRLAGPLVLVLVGTAVVIRALRSGDGSGNVTVLIIGAAAAGTLTTVVLALDLFRRASFATELEHQHGRDLEEWLREAGDEPFANLVRAVCWRWKEGSNADGLETDDLFRNLHYQISDGARTIRGLARPMPVLGLVGTCVSLLSYLDGTVGTLRGVEEVGPAVLHGMGEALAHLPGAFDSTIAGIVAGPLLLWSMANALQTYASHTAMRFEEVVNSYVIPELRARRSER